MVEWDASIEMAGTYPVYWSVTLSEDQQVVVFLSPYQQMPDLEGEEERTGSGTGLLMPLVHHRDEDLEAAAMVMVNLAVVEWIRPRLTRKVFEALREQRERQGGHVAGTTPYTEDNQPNEG